MGTKVDPAVVGHRLSITDYAKQTSDIWFPIATWFRLPITDSGKLSKVCRFTVYFRSLGSRQAGRQAGGQADRPADRNQADGQSGKQPGGQAGRQAGRQAGGQAGE
jgi:predicted transposase YdaD